MDDSFGIIKTQIRPRINTRKTCGGCILLKKPLATLVLTIGYLSYEITKVQLRSEDYFLLVFRNAGYCCAMSHMNFFPPIRKSKNKQK